MTISDRMEMNVIAGLSLEINIYHLYMSGLLIYCGIQKYEIMYFKGCHDLDSKYLAAT